MSSRQNSSSAPSVYRHQTSLPAERPQLNGKAPQPASSGAVSRVSKTTVSTTNTNTSSSTPSARAGLRSPESELITSFDPMKDMHLWTMWRAAVNGRIMDDLRRQHHSQAARGAHEDDNPYGRALVKTPLDRFIRVENGSHSLASLMMDPHGQGGGHLGTKQFVFYGVPRVVLKKPKHTVHLPSDSE